jgi:phosphonate transport system substrate-binding protein
MQPMSDAITILYRVENMVSQQMKKFLSVLLLLLSACNLRADQTASATPGLADTPLPDASAIAQPTAQIGTEANPVILALAPSPHPAPEMIESGEFLAGRLEELTGYQVVTVAPASEADTIRAFRPGNAHIAVLSPFGYLLALNNGDASTSLASLRAGQMLYGAQFIARQDAGFESYFDPLRSENLADAEQALAQFRDRKPCWTDTISPSGYVVPLGYLNAAGVHVRSPAFLEGQAPVVRAVYGKGICDFGATYIDARELPALEADYPDVMEKIEVIWRIPPIIPYEQVVMSTHLTPDMRRALLRAFVDIMTTPEGVDAVQTIYSLESLQPAEDVQYEAFAQYVESAGVDLNTLLR